MDDEYGSEFAENIIQEYREIVIHNLMQKNKNNNIGNIMIIPVATKLAQMSTKDSRRVNMKGKIIDIKKDRGFGFVDDGSSNGLFFFT